MFWQDILYIIAIDQGNTYCIRSIVFNSINKYLGYYKTSYFKLFTLRFKLSLRNQLLILLSLGFGVLKIQVTGFCVYYLTLRSYPIKENQKINLRTILGEEKVYFETFWMQSMWQIDYVVSDASKIFGWIQKISLSRLKYFEIFWMQSMQHIDNFVSNATKIIGRIKIIILSRTLKYFEIFLR